jgi:hypothetical protein
VLLEGDEEDGEAAPESELEGEAVPPEAPLEGDEEDGEAAPESELEGEAGPSEAGLEGDEGAPELEGVMAQGLGTAAEAGGR